MIIFLAFGLVFSLMIFAGIQTHRDARKLEEEWDAVKHLFEKTK